MSRLRTRVRRLEERRDSGSLGEQIVRALEAARTRHSAGDAAPQLPFDHWPGREELERQAAGGCPVSEARLRLWDWPA